METANTTRHRKLPAMGDEWTFLSDHAHVLIALAREPRSDVTAVAKATGIDDSVVGGILRDLEAGGYIRGGSTRVRRSSPTSTATSRCATASSAITRG
jgi:DNA-binding IclR family transcriptional regulator